MIVSRQEQDGLTLTLRVAGSRFLPGCSAGLSEPTALVDIDCAGQPADGFEERIRSGVETLAANPALAHNDADWPQAVAGDEPARVLGRWIEALAVAVQQCSGDPVRQGRVLNADPGRLRLALPWRRRPAVEAALNLAVGLVEQWARHFPDETLVGDLIGTMVDALPDTRAAGLNDRAVQFVRTAVARGVPMEMLPGTVQLGWGVQALRLRDGMDNRANVIGVLAAGNALIANQLMANGCVPLPDGEVVPDLDAAERVVERIGWPAVVKPTDREGSAVLGIEGKDGLAEAFREFAAVNRHGVIVEQHISGNDHRLLVVDGVLLFAELRAGTDRVDVTDAVHPQNRMLAERVARIVGLPTLGVQFRTPDITRPWREVGGAVCGVNARPVAGANRWFSSVRDGEIVDLAFRGGDGRIPTAAISGPGAGAVALLLQRIWLASGTTAGAATTMGLRIGPDLVGTGDSSGQPGGRMLITDPVVKAAVIEMPNGRVHEFGHPCDRYDAVAVLGPEGDASAQAELVERACGAVIFAADHPGLRELKARAKAARLILVAGVPEPGSESVITGEHEDREYVLHVANGVVTPLFPVETRGAGSLREAMASAALAVAHGIAGALGHDN